MLPAGALGAGFAAESFGLEPVLWTGAIGGVLSASIIAAPALLFWRRSGETGYGRGRPDPKLENDDG
jgi:hypothetical protein